MKHENSTDMKNYSKLELDTIAGALNVLIQDSNKTKGVVMNTFHFTRFANKTHYIDYLETTKQFHVYKQYSYFKRNNEIFTKTQQT